VTFFIRCWHFCHVAPLFIKQKTQGDGRMGRITKDELIANCDVHTFDVVLGSDGDGTLSQGTHWDCWMLSSRGVAGVNLFRRNPLKLGKHMGEHSWADHLRWARRLCGGA